MNDIFLSVSLFSVSLKLLNTGIKDIPVARRLWRTSVSMTMDDDR